MACAEPERDDGDIDRQSVLQALLVEHQNIHRRVSDQINAYESTNTKILALIGALFYFGLTNFDKTLDRYMYAIVNLLFVVVIPFVAIASVAFAAAHLCKIMRLRFIAERSPHSYRIYSIEAVLIALLFLGVCAASAFVVSKQREKSMKDVYDDDRV